MAEELRGCEFDKLQELLQELEDLTLPPTDAFDVATAVNRVGPSTFRPVSTLVGSPKLSMLGLQSSQDRGSNGRCS